MMIIKYLISSILILLTHSIFFSQKQYGLDKTNLLSWVERQGKWENGVVICFDIDDDMIKDYEDKPVHGEIIIEKSMKERTIVECQDGKLEAINVFEKHEQNETFYLIKTFQFDKGVFQYMKGFDSNGNLKRDINFNYTKDQCIRKHWTMDAAGSPILSSEREYKISDIKRVISNKNGKDSDYSYLFEKYYRSDSGILSSYLYQTPDTIDFVQYWKHGTTVLKKYFFTNTYWSYSKYNSDGSLDGSFSGKGENLIYPGMEISEEIPPKSPGIEPFCDCCLEDGKQGMECGRMKIQERKFLREGVWIVYNSKGREVNRRFYKDDILIE